MRLPCIKLNPTHHLAIESVAVTFSSLVTHALIILLLGLNGYSDFALGLTVSAFFSFINLSTSMLLPYWIVKYDDAPKKIIDALNFQIFIGILVSSISLIIFFTLSLNLSSLTILSAIFLLISQQIDEALHVYWRLTNHEYLSLKYTLISKILIITLITLVSSITHSGYYTFIIMSLSISLISIVKLTIFLRTTSISIIFLPKEYKKLVSNHLHLWMGNLSNSIFNGAIRIVLGEHLGKSILGMLTLATQVGTSLNGLTYSLTQRIIFNEINTNKKAVNISIAIFILSTLIILSILSTIFLLEEDAKHGIEWLLIIAIPISLSVSIPILTIPYFQKVQKTNHIGKIYIFNFWLSITGLLLIFIGIYIFHINAFLLWINFSIYLLSSTYIYRLSHNHLIA